MLAALLIAMKTCAILAAPALPTASGAAGQDVSAAERFYDDNVELYVDRIAEEIVAFNARHEPHHAIGHDGGGKHGKRPKHARHASKHRADEDADEMQSDQPQPASGGGPGGSQLEQIMRQRAQDVQSPEDRDKLAMTNNIKEKVLSLVRKGNGSKSYVERDRSFYANCDQPKSTEESDDFMKLYFTLPQLEDTIATANIRLYRKSPSNQTSLFDATDVLPCIPGANRDSSADSEKLYRVTLYYHVKGQKKHKPKRKIGDSRVVSDATPYVNLNVLQGIRELNKGKLFGVIVQIEDQFGTIVKAADFFKGPTCTVGMPTPQPLPTVFEEAHTDLGRAAHAANLVRKPVQPKLDVKTIQTPPDDGAGGGGGAASVPTASHAMRCRHAQLRHAHGHHQARARVPAAAIDGAVVVAKAGTGNYMTVDMNALKLMLDRMEEERTRHQTQQFGAT